MQNYRGFTLVELLVVTIIMMVVAGTAAPSIQVWIKNNRVQAAAEQANSLLKWARAEAISQNRFTRAEIHQGTRLRFCATLSINTLCGDSEVIGQFEWNSNQLNIASDSTTNAVVAFDSRGRSTQKSGNTSVTVCDSRGNEYGMVIRISPVGRPALTSIKKAFEAKCL